MQYRINLRAATWRTRKLNEVLPRLQEEFEAALLRGQILELPAGDVAWLNDALVVDES